MTVNTMTLSRVTSRLRARSRIAAAQLYLSMRRQLHRGPFFVDHGFIKLPFSGDGDRQELYYHIDGKEWWEKEKRLMSPYVGIGDVAVDVGANLGFMSGILSSMTGASGQVHSFEPSPQTYAKLQDVIRANHYSNVTAYNLGCGTSEETLTLYCPESSGNASLHPTTGIQEANPKQYTVRIAKMDDFLGPKLDRLDFLKIDTEGYEPEVLGGAIELLKRFKPVIYIELGSLYAESSEKAASLLRNLGYTFDREMALDESFSGDNFFAIPPNWRGPLPGAKLS